MQPRSAAKLAGIVCFAALLPVLMGPTGGLPSQPQFQSVGIGTTAPATAGNLAITGTMTQGTVPVARVSGLAPSATTDATNANNITSGTLADGRLSANIPLKNAANVFTNGSQSITSASGFAQWTLTPASGAQSVYTAFDSTSTHYIQLCISGVANVCEPSGGGSLANAGYIRVSDRFDVDLASTTVLDCNSGTCNLAAGSTVGAKNVCLADGTNCPAATALGACTFKIQSNGAANPTVVSSRGCGTVSSPTRSAVGSWNITTGLTMTTSWAGLCQFDGNGANPAAFNFMTAAPATPSSSKISLAIWTSAVAAVDPAAAQQYVCTVGT